MSKIIGILTSGGDAPGMNAAVISVVSFARSKGYKVVGIKGGYDGVLLKDSKFDVSKISDPEQLTEADWKALEPDIVELTARKVREYLGQPGTFLHTARCDEFVQEEYQKIGANNLRALGITSVVVVGGDGSYKGARALSRNGISCVCIPGTIDNDLAYTEATLGYDTAVNTCMDAVIAVKATSRSHDRPAIVQVMGRHCGDIGMRTAMATGAEMLIVPEMEWDIDSYAARLNRQIERGNTSATLIICENCFAKMKPFDWRTMLRDNGIKVYDDEDITVEHLAQLLKIKCGGAEVRATVVGYTQRGGLPTACDNVLAFQFGRHAVELLEKGQTNQCIGVRDGKVFNMAIEEALEMPRTFDEELYHIINRL
ncbi:MAG: ATP-dependent 6-phosphofructokinase [Clostridiales bacterium]|nr:ATP-dependent 6-phosphofructokinase [Clostridiales bacterium]